jgi:hypothetical protein
VSEFSHVIRAVEATILRQSLIDADLWNATDARDPFADMNTAWIVVEGMAARMGYDSPGFSWVGPLFKPEHHYLTEDGYPLGTTCWYVRLEHDGYIKNLCADTAKDAIRLATMEVLGMHVWARQ